MEYNCALEMNVLMKGYSGNWREAIKESVDISNRLLIPIRLIYANQHAFLIKPNMPNEDIENILNTKMVIGV
jgi:hypothetical protein